MKWFSFTYCDSQTQDEANLCAKASLNFKNLLCMHGMSYLVILSPTLSAYIYNRNCLSWKTTRSAIKSSLSRQVAFGDSFNYIEI